MNQTHIKPSNMPKALFEKKNPFYNKLREQVEIYFLITKKRKTGDIRLYVKTLIFTALSILLYLMLLLLNLSPPIGFIFCALLGATLAGIGFNIMHDAVHGCYSEKKWVNDLFSLTLNILGGNAHIYKQKHSLHHNYTNIDGLDDDIAKSPLFRQCESQRWLLLHKYQHLYLFPVYALSGLAWITIIDFTKYFSQELSGDKLRRMTLYHHFIFWLSKILYIIFYMLLPVSIVGFTKWFAGYCCMNVVMGLILAFIFQPAHLVEGTYFSTTQVSSPIPSMEWAIHQVKTSSNFGVHNSFLNWYAGGLNFQIEHHLFPKISHIHYPAISKIVRSVCDEYNLTYNVYPTFSKAVYSHIKLMKKLGRPPLNQ